MQTYHGGAHRKTQAILIHHWWQTIHSTYKVGKDKGHEPTRNNTTRRCHTKDATLQRCIVTIGSTNSKKLLMLPLQWVSINHINIKIGNIPLRIIDPLE